MKDLISLSTVTLNISEIRDFVPVESPTFVTRLQRTWRDSLDGLLNTIQTLAIVAVAVIPWCAVFGVFVVILWILVRRWRR